MNRTVLEKSWLSELRSVSSLKELRESIFEQYSSLAPGNLKRLAILGAGSEGNRLAEICSLQNIEIEGVYDNNAGMRGVKVGGKQVIPSDALGKLDRGIPIIVASHRVLGAIEMLRAMEFMAVPFGLLQVGSPDIFTPHMFYKNLLEDLFLNRERYLELESCLSDVESRRVLNGIVGFRLTFDPAELSDIIDWDLYGSSGLISFSSREVYVDGGSYDGDSIRMFMDHAGGRFERILGFEPDPGTYAKLVRNFENEGRVETHNAGLHRKKALLSFVNDGTRGATFIEKGDSKIPVVGLDEILNGERVSFIKMNIEGSELDALWGAENSIKKWRPKLAISTYHRPSDLWEIPELIRNLVPDYQLYLRQHDGGIIESVIYAYCK